MQMIHDAAAMALQSEALKKLFESERAVLDMEDGAKMAAAEVAADHAKADRISDACRAKADKLAEAAERAAFDKRRAAKCA